MSTRSVLPHRTSRLYRASEDEAFPLEPLNREEDEDSDALDPSQRPENAPSQRPPPIRRGDP